MKIQDFVKDISNFPEKKKNLDEIQIKETLRIANILLENGLDDMIKYVDYDIENEFI